MEIVQPQFGLFFWTFFIFLVLFFILRKFAWKPILTALEERESHIAESLAAAEEARKSFQALQAQSETLQHNAQRERAEILEEANKMRTQLLAEAKEQAAKEVAKKLAEGEHQLQAAKQAALAELRNLAGNLAIEIAEKLLRKELEKTPEQQRLVEQSLQSLSLN